MTKQEFEKELSKRIERQDDLDFERWGDWQKIQSFDNSIYDSLTDLYVDYFRKFVGDLNYEDFISNEEILIHIVENSDVEYEFILDEYDDFLRDYEEEIEEYENDLKEMKNQIKDYYSSDLERRIKIKQKTIDYRKRRIIELKEEL